jgi:hypothetical protein
MITRWALNNAVKPYLSTLLNTANMYSGITVKTHVKTVKLNHSGLLYHVQVFVVQSTTQKCT